LQAAEQQDQLGQFLVIFLLTILSLLDTVVLGLAVAIHPTLVALVFMVVGPQVPQVMF
jgi:hypothetical protein